jgi:ABC-type transport system involved in multi-copper enzyme maturation permease subunit
MNNEFHLWSVVWASAVRSVFSLRGLIALLFSVFMIGMAAFAFDKLPAAFFELIKLFTPDPNLQFQWFLFDSSMSKLITLFIAPIFIFDAVSGDRGDDRLGLMLSKPISRTQYLAVKLLSASLAFGIIYLPTIALGYPAFAGIVQSLTPTSYFGTAILVYLLGFFTLSVGLLVSTLTKRSVVSFIAMFGVMAVLMLPNSMKYTSDTLDNVAMTTPHYYATYFTSHPFDGGLCAGFAVMIILFSIPFIQIAVWKFRMENL